MPFLLRFCPSCEHRVYLVRICDCPLPPHPDDLHYHCDNVECMCHTTGCFVEFRPVGDYFDPYC